MEKKFFFFENDICKKELDWVLDNCKYIGMDTETTGLNPLDDYLCLVQIAANELFFIIRIHNPIFPANLVALLQNSSVTKVFHNANFDIRFFMRTFNISIINNVVCTKVAAKIISNLKEKNSLADLLYNYLGVKVDKQEQTSDWTREDLKSSQIDYAINDVKYLVQLWAQLKIKLEENELLVFAQKCFEFLPTQAYLENHGIPNVFQY
jgi:ribonuclease D